MLAVLFFVIIAVMRVIQSVGGKRASIEVKEMKTFFCYGVYYEALAAVIGLISVAITGFKGLNAPTVICGAVTAVFLMINFYASLNAVKGCKLIVSSMASNGGMVIACFVSSFWFGESIGVLQYIGLVLFLAAAYLLSSVPKAAEVGEKKKISKGTWVLLAVVMLSEGGVEVSQKYFSVRVGGNSAWFSFFMFAVSAAIMAVGLIRETIKGRGLNGCLIAESGAENLAADKKATGGERARKGGLNKTLYICGALLATAVFVVNLLITELGKTINTVVLFPVSASIGICITVLVGWIVYKEKLTAKNIVGVVAGLCAVILLAI